MCEFDVILSGRTVFKDVIYAREEGNRVLVKNILGESQEYENCRIEEVDVNTARLVLSVVSN